MPSPSPSRVSAARWACSWLSYSAQKAAAWARGAALLTDAASGASAMATNTAPASAYGLGILIPRSSAMRLRRLSRAGRVTATLAGRAVGKRKVRRHGLGAAGPRGGGERGEPWDRAGGGAPTGG